MPKSIDQEEDLSDMSTSDIPISYSYSDQDDDVDSPEPTPKPHVLKPVLAASGSDKLMAAEAQSPNVGDQDRHSWHESEASESAPASGWSSSPGPGQGLSGASPQPSSSQPETSTVPQPKASTGSGTRPNKKTPKAYAKERRMYGYWFPNLSKI